MFTFRKTKPIYSVGVYKGSVCTSQRTHCASKERTNRQMLYRKTVAVS